MKGICVWSVKEEGDADSIKLANRLDIPRIVSEKPPTEGEWIFFYDEGELFLHSLGDEFKPLSVNYLEGEFVKRWRRPSSKDLLLRAVGKKKDPISICDPTCGLGYDAFFLATQKGYDLTVCERNFLVAELAMNALLRVKEEGRFEEFPFFFHLGDGIEFLKRQEAGAFDVVMLDPMYPRSIDQSAKQRKEMVFLRALAGDDQDAGKLFQEAERVAKKRVIVKRPDKAPSITPHRKPDFQVEGSTVRYDIYLNTKEVKRGNVPNLVEI